MEMTNNTLNELLWHVIQVGCCELYTLTRIKSCDKNDINMNYTFYRDVMSHVSRAFINDIMTLRKI